MQSLLKVHANENTYSMGTFFAGLLPCRIKSTDCSMMSFEGQGGDPASLRWAPAVDIYETEYELVVKADLRKSIPRIGHSAWENNILTIRGERKFEKKVEGRELLRVERAYGSFARSFTLANTVNSDAIKAEYQNGVLTLTIPKKEEAKPKQIQGERRDSGMAASGSGR